MQFNSQQFNSTVCHSTPSLVAHVVGSLDKAFLDSKLSLLGGFEQAAN